MTGIYVSLGRFIFCCACFGRGVVHYYCTTPSVDYYLQISFMRWYCRPQLTVVISFNLLTKNTLPDLEYVLTIEFSIGSTKGVSLEKIVLNQSSERYFDESCHDVRDRCGSGTT